MVAIFAGSGSGFQRSSGNILGPAGLLGSAVQGRSGETVSVNAATGNLLIGQQDEFLVGLGPDVAISRTYNSLAQMSDGDNGDLWQQSTMRRVFGLTGTLNTAGSTISRQSGDGSVTVYTWNTTQSAYVTTDGDGAHDKLVKSGATWVWTDGSSQFTETYETSAGDPSVFRIKEARDTVGSKLAFAYIAGTDKLDMVTTGNHGTINATTGVPEQSYVRYIWSGNNIAEVVTGYTDYGATASEGDNVNKVLTRTRYDYDASNRLSTVTVDLSPDDNSIANGKTYITTYTYDGASNRVASITQTDGSSLSITYDGSGRVATLTQAVTGTATRVTILSYQSGYTDITGPDGEVTRLDYDAAKQLTKITAPRAYTGATAQNVQFAYDAAGNLTSVTDGAGEVTTYTYDANGNILTVTDSLGNVVTRAYGARNELLTEARIGSDASGAAVEHVTHYVYGTANQLRYVVSAEGRVTEYRYTATGQLAQEISYPGHVYSTGSAAPIEAEVNDWSDGLADRRSLQIVEYSYDTRGNQIGRVAYSAVTLAGNPVLGDEGRSTLVYDQAGKLLSSKTAAQNAETFLYDGLGRLVGSTDLTGGMTTILFDDAATKTVVTLANGLLRTSAYNKVGELVSYTEAAPASTLPVATGTATYAYDAAGRLRWQTDATGRRSYFLYDGVGRKVMDISHAGDVVEYRYDLDNRLVAKISYANRLAASLVSSLDDAGIPADAASFRPPASVASAPSQDMWHWYVYDAQNRLVQTIDSLGQTSINRYDNSGRLIETVNYRSENASRLVDPAEFGARYDNSQDDGPALLQAIAKANLIGGQVYIPAGRTLWTNGVVLPERASIVGGDRYTSVIKLRDTSAYDARLLDGRSLADGDILISNLTLDGSKSATLTETVALELHNAKVSLSALEVKNGAIEGIYLYKCDDAVLENIHTYENGFYRVDASGVHIDTSARFRITGLVSNYNGFHGLILSQASDGYVEATLFENGWDGVRTQWGTNRVRFDIVSRGNARGIYFTTGSQNCSVAGTIAECGNGLLTNGATDIYATCRISGSDENDVYLVQSGDSLHWEGSEAPSVNNEGSGRITFGTAKTPALPAGYVDPAEFGAKYDNSQDDGPALLQAIAKANLIGGKVYIPAGRTLWTDGVVLPETVSLVGGDRYTSVIKLRTSAAYDTRLLDGRSLTSGMISISNLTLDGSKSASLTETVALEIHNAKVVLTELEVRNGAIEGIYLYKCDDARLDDIHAFENGDYRVDASGLHIDTSTRFRVTGLVSHNNGFHGIILSEASDGYVQASLYDNGWDGVRAQWGTNGVRFDIISRGNARGAYFTTGSHDCTVAGVLIECGNGLLTNEATNILALCQSAEHEEDDVYLVAAGDSVLWGGTETPTVNNEGPGTFELLPTGIHADIPGTIAAPLIEGYKSAPPTSVVHPWDAARTENVTRFFYDADGLLRGTLDGEGFVVEYKYDGAGQKIEEIAYSSATARGVRAKGSFDQIVGTISTSGEDRHTRFVYNGQGQLRFLVDAERQVTETCYNPAGQVGAVIRYATAFGTGVVDFGYGSIKNLLSAAGFASQKDQWHWEVRNEAGQLVQTIDSLGYTTVYGYDAMGRLVKSIQYARAIASATLGELETDLPTGPILPTSVPGDDRTTRYYYDAAGALRFTIDAAGYVVRRDEDAEGRQIATKSWAGAIGANLTDTSTIEDVALLTASAGDSIGTETEYDIRGQVKASTDGEGFVTRFEYNADGTVQKEIHAYGTADESVAYFVYDKAGRKVEEHRAFGTAEVAITKFEYDALGNIVRIVGPAGKIITQNFDRIGQLISRTEWLDAAIGYTTAYDYNAFGEAIETKGARGEVETRRYDELGRLLESRIDTTGQQVTSSWEYDAFGNVVLSRDARGSATYIYYDDLNRRVLERDAEDYLTGTSYTAFGDVASVTRYYNVTGSTASTKTLPTVAAHSKDATTSFEYDKRGLVTKTTDAEGWSESFGYDAYGNRTSVTGKSKDASTVAGGTTTYVYDKRGLLVSETLPFAAYKADGTVQASTITNSYSYDGRGNRTQMIEAAGLTEARVTSYAYDKLDRLTKTRGQARTILDQAGHNLFTNGFVPEESIAYDAAGNITTVTDAAGNRTVYFYDDLGRNTVEISAAGTYTRHDYDANGNIIETRIYEGLANIPLAGGGAPPLPPIGDYRATSFVYDNLNRLSGSIVSGINSGSYANGLWTGAATALGTALVYDAMGNVVKAVDANGNATWSYYDRAGRKTAQVDASNYLTTWTYDAEGNVLLETRYSAAVAAPTSMDAPPAPPLNDTAARVTAFTYDKVGNRLSEARSDVTVYDGAGGVLAPQTVTVSWQYNGLGQVIRKTEATGDQAEYIYDVGGRLIQETRAAFSDFEDATPNASPNATPTVDYRYDGLGALVRSVAAGQGATLDRVTTYTYGAGGLLSTLTDAEGAVHTYRYDKRGALIADEYMRENSAGSGDRNAVLTKVDAAGRVIERTIATWHAATSAWIKGDVATTEYNAYGEVARSGINGGTVSESSRLWQTANKYDAAGRLWATNADDGVWKMFGYDKNGNQTITIANAGTSLTGKTFDEALGLVSGAGVNATYTVYDKRNMATSTVEEGRQLIGTGDSQTLTSTRTYNAFGDVVTETNALGAVTTYVYNNIGRLIRSEGPTVQITLENGSTLWVKPSQDYYYDKAGRLVATRDANGTYAAGGTSTNGTSKAADSGNLTRLTLLAGTGYNGSEALVTAETHADGGIKQTRYDIHGDARTLIDELNRSTAQVFDGLGRVTQVSHAGGLIDYYAYDGLGQRIKHWNNLLGSGDVESTDYDTQGRVVATRAFGGDVTTTSYTWDGSIAAISGVTTGGWTEVTRSSDSAANLAASIYKQASDKSDMFGRITWKSDLGAHVTTYVYDVAGRQTSSTTGGLTVTFTYYNGGQIATNSGPAGTATYTYDNAGNRLSENLVSGGVTIKNQTATYDAMGRLVTWAEAGTAKSPTALTTNSYDANGNIRKTYAEYRSINATGVAATGASTTSYWFAYDSMNRVTIDRGIFLGVAGSGIITRGSEGMDIEYNQAGERMTTRKTRQVEGLIWHYREIAGEPGGYYTQGQAPGISLETYEYDAAGRLKKLYEAASEISSDENGTYATNPVGPGTLRGEFTYDLMGRVTLQKDYNGAYGYTGVTYSRSITYNAKGQVTSDDVSTLRRRDDPTTYYDTFKSVTTYGYGSGSTYALGSVLSQSAVNSKLLSGSSSWTSDPGTLTTTTYAWYDGAVQDYVSYDRDTGSSSNALYTTDLLLNGFGQLTGATVADGIPKSVAYTLDENGQIIRRDETRTSAPTQGAPHEVFYRFGGRQMGMAGNNGTDNINYSESVIDRSKRTPQPTASDAGLFRSGFNTGVGYADFAQSLNPINSNKQGSAGGLYTVQAGDTLQRVAATLWGDANLWYKLAEANGMSANSALIEGQSLVLPTGVSRNTHSADSFKPYDPVDALGDLSPTTPKPPKKPNCGVFGQILVAAIAIGVAAWAGPGAIAFFQSASVGLGAVGGAIVGGAVAGAAGSVVSQGVGVATGIQDKFSFKQVGLAALGGAIGGGLGKFNALGEAASGSLKGIANAAIQGVAVNALTQGIGVATGLQSKFDFAGVAAAGVAAGVGYGVGKIAGATSLLDNGSIANIGANVAVGAARLFANAATRSAIRGNSFGDNIVAALPDAIGQIVGDAVAGRVVRNARGREIVISGNPVDQGQSSVGGYGGGQIGSGDEIVVTAQIGVSSHHVDYFPAATAVQVDYDVQTGGVEYAIAQQKQRIARGIGEWENALITPLPNSLRTYDAIDGKIDGYPDVGPYLLSEFELYARSVELRDIFGPGSANYDPNVYGQIEAGIAYNYKKLGEWTAMADRAVDGSIGAFTASGAAGALTLLSGGGLISALGLEGVSAFGANALVAGAVNANTNAALVRGLGRAYSPSSYRDDFVIGTASYVLLAPVLAFGGRIFGSSTGVSVSASAAAESAGVRIATEGSSVAGRGESLLLNQIRDAGGTLPVSRGQFGVQDFAGASRAGGNEVAYFRDRATGQLYVRELGPQMGNIPENSRLILHTQPGSMPLSVQPSAADRAALSALGQRSSVITNFDGTYAIRFRPNNAGDGAIRWIGN